MQNHHLHYMKIALKLAAKGKGFVSPNPCVGCVLVKNGKIVGSGYHQIYGGPHAEVVAIRHAGSKARGAIAYLTLEPCNHWGKTPPCAPQLVNAGITQAYIAMRDPNPIVSGRGIARLKRGKLQVHLGLCEQEAKSLNQAFVTRMKQNRPHIVLKMAMTLDGKIATRSGSSKWISGPLAREFGFKLRSESDAVLVGASTATIDDPSLTSHQFGRDPMRIVFDPHLRTPVNLKMYNDHGPQTVVVASPRTSNNKEQKLAKKGVQILRNSLKNGAFELLEFLRYTVKNNINQLLIEGGGSTTWGFLKRGLVDEIYLFMAPKLVGGRESPTPIDGDGFAKLSQGLGFTYKQITRIGPDLMIHAVRS